MNAGDEDLNAVLAELRQAFLARMESDQQTITVAWAECGQAEHREAGARKLAGVAHKLAGMGTTFGYPEITDYGLAVESAAERLAAGNAEAMEELAAHVDLLLGALSIAAADKLPNTP